ncbi:MAG: thiamine phosphate synthase [Ancrocorticia sp.]|uniref:thiamine phosphate synthase n=1 Tax=Ancrocorticia sp. TaxID=2593684 RepID=UPI003F8E7598
MRTTGPLDVRCYLVTSGTDSRTVGVAAEAAAGGAGIIQVRAKDLSTSALLQFSGAVADAVQRANPHTAVVIDDRTDVAFAAVRAGHAVAGVHLGQDDLPVPDARAMLGPDAIIGLTTGTLQTVQAADATLVDYLGAGPFRPTPTKDPGRPPLGLASYPEFVAATTIPVVAIGDVTPADVADLAATGVAGVAFVRAIMASDHPRATVSQILGSFAAAQTALAAQTAQPEL